MTPWITLILTSALAIAAERGPDRPRGPRHRGPEDIEKFIDRVADAVDATEEQVAQLDAIAAEQKAAGEAARAQREQLTEEQRTQVRDIRKQMRKARREGDDSRIEELRAQIREITGHEPGSLMKDMHDKIAAVLTPDQATAFEKMTKKHRRGRGDRERRHPRKPKGRHGRPMDFQRFIDRVVNAVDATEEQKVSLDVIAKEYSEAARSAREQAATARKENREQIEDLRNEMREAQMDGDTEAVELIRERIRTLIGPPREELTQATFAKIAEVLTEEQLPAFEALKQQAKAQKGQRRPRKHRGAKGKRHRRPERRRPNATDED